MIKYDVHPSVPMVRDQIARLKDKTGKSLDEWVTLIKQEGPEGKRERQAWLKEQHGLGTNYASWLGAIASGEENEYLDPDRYLENAAQWVEELYAGPKQPLRPMHNALITMAQQLGEDIRISPCQTMVPIYRKHVIAQIKPATRARIDFGLALGDTPATGKLIDTGGFAKKDRITHRIAITTMEDIDDEVRDWLHKAYDRDAG